MALISFQDAVTAANLDPNQTHAVYYTDGRYANRSAVAARCPNAKLYGITVFGETGVGIFACDSEIGDLDVPQTIAWVNEQIKLGVKLICVYANESRWLNEGLLSQIQAIEKAYGIDIKKWVAHYDNLASIPSWADAKQYADPGPVDRNVALASFFGDAAPAPKPADPNHYDWFDNTPRMVYLKARRERGQVELYDKLRAMQTPKLHPRRVQLAFVRKVLLWYAKRVATVAIKNQPDKDGTPSWGVDHRGWRYQQLLHRSQGQRLAQ